jgi:Tol biopolymer transport system component
MSRRTFTNLGRKLVLASLLAASVPAMTWAAPPTQSPPKAKIAFHGKTLSGLNIYTMNDDGSSVVQLTSDPADEFQARWSPDGKRIAFTRGRDQQAEIYVMNADGTNQTRITNNNEFDAWPTWSPDGKKIAFNAIRAGVAWTEIYVINSDGSGEATLLSDAKDNAIDYEPAWSPDGKKIAYRHREGNNKTYEIYVMNTDGSGKVNITNTPNNDESTVAWSHDSSKLAFISRQSVSIYTYVAVMNADGTGVTRITSDEKKEYNHPTWSPDDTKIAFGDVGNDAINVIGVNGSDNHRVSPQSHFGYLPNWQPVADTSPNPTPVPNPTPTTLTPLAPPVALPGTGTQTFPETKKTTTGLFLDYWTSNGMLAQQGFPLSEVMGEKSDLNGQVYTVQYFERAVFEYHPEITDPKYKVLLSQLGTFQYKKKYAQGAPGQIPDNSTGSRLFPETGKRIGGRFLEYWTQNGGLAQQGLPLSDPFMEKSETNGQTYMVQYFERAVFELHTENAKPNDVLLSLLGVFQYKAKYQGGSPPQPQTTPQPTVLPTQPAANPCDNVPATINTTITPNNCAKAGARFTFEGRGFDPGEKVGFYVTRPDGSVGGTPSQVEADSQGRTTGNNAVVLTTVASSQPGQWAVTMEGVTSHKKAIGYVKVLAP